MDCTFLAAEATVSSATVSVCTLAARGDAVDAYADPAIMRPGW
jgi:hypothetical protein